MKPAPASILCATDFSPASSRSADVAATLARARAEDVCLVHVTDPRGGQLATRARKRLAAEAERLGAAGGNVETLLLRHARPWQALLEHIEVQRPALVIVSSGPKGPLDRWVIGSFSERIVQSSPVPTMVIRHAAAFESWQPERDPLTLLLALDLHTSSDVVLRWAREFRRGTPSELVSCHINRRMPVLAENGAEPGPPRNPPALQQRLERELRRKVRDQMGDDPGALVVRPYFGDPGRSIAEVAAERKAHLVVVGTHQRRGLGRFTQFSVARELLQLGSVNLVCVPVSTQFDPREAHLPEFRRVLVTTDFSDLGNSAIPLACAACSIGGLVRIVHVAPPRRDRPGRAARKRVADLREQLRALIPDQVGARLQPPEVEVLEEDEVANAILVAADRFGADLVCVASHGLGLSRALHGSVTKALLKNIRRPLLVIRRPEE